MPLSYYSGQMRSQVNRAPIKVRVVQSPPKAAPKPKDEDKKEDAKGEKIVETPMQPTERPKETKRLGPQDHVTEKETKTKLRPNQQNTADAGNKGNPDARPEQPDQLKVTEAAKNNKPSDAKEMVVSPDKARKLPNSKLDFDGKVPMLERPKPRNAYEAMLPSSKDLYGQVNAGYQEFVDDSIDEGDRIDLNTAEYKYISYFTKLRKAISLVWVYPTDASRRGMQGEVLVEWIIMKDGSVKRIRIIKSSGYDILDEAILTAIKLASPFPNLPEAWKVERKVIVGTFKYILTDYAGTH